MNDERTIYDDEKTQYQSQNEEATQFDEANENKLKEQKVADDKTAEKEEKRPTWQRAAAGFGSGILLGSTAALFSSSAPIDHTEEGEGQPGSPEHPDWTDGEVPVATSVSDDMSFSEAFGAARTEVGSGGVFEWHGNIYSTYTEEEWGNMTAEERDEYGSHFNWHSDASHDTASSSSAAQTDEVEVIAANTDNEHGNQGQAANSDEVEVADVTPGTVDGNVGHEKPEVEVLGVVHDDETGANIGGMVVDGQDVVLIDVDGDGKFEGMGVDLNGDHQFTQDEFVDISGQNLTVNDLGGISNPDNSTYTSNNDGMDGVDNIATYEG